MQQIQGIDAGSIAEELGVQPGDALIRINGEAVLDVVDYTHLCTNERLLLEFLGVGGYVYEAEIEKDAYEPLGLQFESGLMSSVKSCKNHCIFCFIDQMPKGGRKTLSFKDDDWRMSFIMGNYISLTNVDDVEFQRILDRRVSPLYISVHATDPDVRTRMMRNKHAGKLMDRLRTLGEHGLHFHCQIVCCPGINDGKILQRSMEDLYSLYPAAQSLAVVPVGLTKFRSGLSELKTFTAEGARRTVEQIWKFAKRCKQESGTSFVFASDEFIISAKMRLPAYAYYEDFGQIENGVGLLRSFEEEFVFALSEQKPLLSPLYFDAAGGVLAHDFFVELFERLKAYHLCYRIHAIINTYFGESVTVGGLITGQDLVAQLKGNLQSQYLLLPHNMLREKEDVFLDGMTVADVEDALGIRVIPVRGEGEAWVETIFRLSQNQ